VARLEIFVVEELDPPTVEVMRTTYDARVGCLRSKEVPVTPVARLVQHVRHLGSPTRVARRDWDAIRRDLRSWMATYDLTVVELVDDLVVLGPLFQGPVVVDHDDRDSDVVRQTRALFKEADARRSHRRGGRRWILSTGKSFGRDLYLRLDQQRWLRAERLAARRADLVLVASDEDRLTAQDPAKAVVIPNGFERRGRPVGSPVVRTPPTVAFWGRMSYRPNADGARWLLDEVLPLLVRRVPDVRIVLIGAGSEQLKPAGATRVVATGFVDDLAVWLAQTDVALVPLRAGGGTRIKIIEAWANGIPVVSTSLGAYGLRAVNGTNVLLADEPDAFAGAVALALEDQAVRDRLIQEGTVRAEELRWSVVEQQLADHLARLMT
jgi:glycosyltransferase involved in cell wall biosynthesis